MAVVVETLPLGDGAEIQGAKLVDWIIVGDFLTNTVGAGELRSRARTDPAAGAGLCPCRKGPQ